MQWALSRRDIDLVRLVKILVEILDAISFKAIKWIIAELDDVLADQLIRRILESHIDREAIILDQLFVSKSNACLSVLVEFLPMTLLKALISKKQYMVMFLLRTLAFDAPDALEILFHNEPAFRIPVFRLRSNEDPVDVFSQISVRLRVLCGKKSRAPRWMKEILGPVLENL